jgi:predicted  nucleic acid-binding Zn-ribbon protein
MASPDRSIFNNKSKGASCAVGGSSRLKLQEFVMQLRFGRHLGVLIAFGLVICFCLVEAGAQKRKRRSRRLVPSASAVPSPTPDESADPADPRIVSTADQSSGTTRRTDKKPQPVSSPTPESDAEVLRRTISDLSGQINKLNDKLSQVEEQQRSLVDLERLNRAEQRAEMFRSQLRDLQQKEVDISGQLDQIEYALQPENIERAIGIMGTTHPEEARDQRRRQLESQRAKLKTQYEQLEQGRVRLETAIVTADQEVETLRARLEGSNAEGNPAQPKTVILPPQGPSYTPTPRPPQ